MYQYYVTTDFSLKFYVNWLDKLDCRREHAGENVIFLQSFKNNTFFIKLFA